MKLAHIPLKNTQTQTIGSDQATIYYIEVAVNRPLFQTFTYAAQTRKKPTVGTRVLVSIGPSQEVGIISEVHNNKPERDFQIKSIIKLLDEESTLSKDVLALLSWASHYYLQPIGEMLFTFLPSFLKQNKPLTDLYDQTYLLNTQNSVATENSIPTNAHKQQEAFNTFKTKNALTKEELTQHSISQQTLNQLIKKNLICKQAVPPKPTAPPYPHQPEHKLTAEQANAVTHILQSDSCFQSFLLEGITGSGKTEVYTQLCRHFLALNKQILLLVPEIGLTPQLQERLKERLDAPVVVLHSDIANKERAYRWLQTKHETPMVVLGTRSALACNLPKLGCIILDEEHDHSFKQQEGIRYHSKNLALVRARNLSIPIVLGSATPSLESYHNANTHKHTRIKLTKRATGAKLPELHLIDTNKLPPSQVFSDEAISHIETTLSAHQQVLVFINRRGYAPTIQCNQCHWVAECQNCDVSLTVHKSTNSLDCHHCETKHPIPSQCPVCNSPYLQAMGFGSQRIESELNQLFPNIKILRMDRDSTQTKGSLEKIREELNTEQPCILVGTQMVAKGHDFPNLTLTVVLNSDNGLHSHDFRGTETLTQTLIQVAGRSGRKARGQVLIQTNYPEHPIFEVLKQQDYKRFALTELQHRQEQQLPPFSHQATIRMNSLGDATAASRLTNLQQILTNYSHTLPKQSQLHISSAMPATIERKSNWYRYLIVLSSPCRNTLHHSLHFARSELLKSRRSKKLKWVIDVDPIDTI
ncbi:primosomal protein N' [Litoribacillus peritrichatus]|uniref:Replication restart protein PriA n=1 Tax=Litoribacillus peritrichatus TaxID=718191 RepID=A0ABP7MT40_9GAMM